MTSAGAGPRPPAQGNPGAQAALIDAIGLEIQSLSVTLRKAEAALLSDISFSSREQALLHDVQLLDLVIQTLDELGPLVCDLSGQIDAGAALDIEAMLADLRLAGLRARLRRSASDHQAHPIPESGAVDLF